MRKLKLINGDGQTFDLNTKSAFFHSIGGFGFNDSTSYEMVGRSYLSLDETYAQGEIRGSILFAGDRPYESYRRFANFIRSGDLTLVYQLDTEFKVPVRVSEIEKAELKGSFLDCPIAFKATGLFYRIVKVLSGTVQYGGKEYDYEYPFCYENAEANTVMIDSDSYEDSPCKITIFGPCIEPIWKHYVEHDLYARGYYPGTVPYGHKLVIDTSKIPYSITERGAGDVLVADRYQLCDFSTERFILLQHGQNRISVSHKGFNDLKVQVEGKISYETV